MRALLLGMVVGIVGCASSQKQATTPPVHEEAEAQPPTVDEQKGVTGDALDDVQRFFTSKRRTVANCYSDAVNSGKLDRKTSGRITVAVEIQTDGSVKHARITDDQLKSEDVENCVTKMVEGWSVPPPNVAFPFSYSYAFLSE